MSDDDRGRVFLSILFLCVGLFILLLCLLAGGAVSADGAEPEPLQAVWVCVRTDITTNSGYGVYLGGDIVAVEKNITQGSRNMRASVTFLSPDYGYVGAIVSPNIIKLDNVPDFAGRPAR